MPRLSKGLAFALSMAALAWVATGPLDGPVAITTNASAGAYMPPSLESPAVAEPDISTSPDPGPPDERVVAPLTTSKPGISAWDAWHSNWLMIPAVRLSIAVADHNDCASTVLTAITTAARNWCAFSPIVYLVGHNPGVFTPLLGLRDGDAVRYWDKHGHATTYQITSINHTYGDEALPFMMDNSWPHLVLQTCAVLDGSQDWIYVARPI